MADDSDPYAILMTPLAPSAPPIGPPTQPDPYDILTKPLLADPAASVSGYEAAGGRATYGDVWQGVKAGWHGVAADAAGALAAVQEPGGPRTATQSFALSQEEAAHQAEQEMTPSGQAPGFFKHPLVSTAEAAPGIAAIAAPAALAGPFAPLVVGGLMGVQQLGTAQNRAAEQGYELTPTQKTEQFAIGAATGLVPELGLPAKIATTPLVNRALGVVEGGATFGAGAAGGEAVSQQSEIDAGKRQGYDPSAIVGAGVSGAEQGAGFMVFHSGRHRDPTQTPGVATVPRVPAEQVATETKPRNGVVAAPADQPASVADASPPPAPPKVDPDQAAALNPQPATTPDVTPGVTEPPKLPVKQPEVVQPTPPPPEMAREAPPALDTTKPVSPLQPAPEVGPAPAPAPPEQVLREPDQTLIDQHAALTDKSNPREAMVWPPDVQPLDLPNKSRYGQGTLNDGRIIQYDRSGASKLSKDKVKYVDDNNRLNEILQLGPTTKDEAVARVAAGEPGVGVVERTPDGTEAKAAAATSTTAPDTLAAMEATKTPGNVVGVEHPDTTLAAREQGLQPQEPVVQPERVVTPESNLTQTPFGPGRVLEAQDEVGVRARDEALRQEAEQVRTVQDQLKARELAKQEAAAKAAGAKGRQHISKEVQDKVTSSNAAAEKIVAAHPHVGSYADANAVLARAKAMARAAGVEGIDIPKVFGEGHPWNAAMLKLREAKDLLSPIKKELGETREDKLGRFIDREHMIDNGRMEEALAARRAEAAQGLGSPEGAVETGKQDDLEKPEDIKEAPAEHELVHETPTEHAVEGGGEEHAGQADRGEELKKLAAAKALAKEQDLAAAKATANLKTKRSAEVIEIGHREARPTVEPERPKVVEQAEEGKHFTAGKAAMGFKQEVRKDRSIKRQEMEEGHPGRKIMQADEDGNPQEITSVRQSTAREAIDEHYDPKQYSPAERQMNEHLIDKLNHLAGDTEVHYISHDDMTKLGGPNYGFYDPVSDKIYLNNDYNKHDTALHEVFHAATAKALEKSPELKALMERLRNDVRANMPLMDVQSRGKVEYALSDPEEFLTGMMTNPEVQKLLKGVKISDELARDIGIPRWRKATMWNGILHIIQRALGLSPRDVSAIEGAMAITERTMWKQDPGMAMEASARLGAAEGRLRFQKMDPPERDQEAYFKSPSEKIASVKSIDKDMVKGYAKDLAGSTKVGLLAKTAKFLSGTQLSDLHGKIFKDAKGNILEAINRARDKVTHTFNEARKGDRDLINRGYILDRKYASRMGDYAELLNLSSRFNIHADRDAPAVPKNPVDAPRKNWQSNVQGDRARALYKSLPIELQKRYIEEKKFYRDKQQALAKTVLDKTLPVLDLPKDMEERARNNDLTEEDWEKLEDMHAATPIRNAQRLINKKDVYFPGGRGDGRFVVTGRYEMPKGGSDTAYSGEQLAGNKREFNTEQQAHDYVTNTHLPANVRETTYWTDPATGKIERKTAGEAASLGTITKKYEVSLERQHTEMHDDHAAAVKARTEMEKAGVGELSGVLDRRNERAWSSIGSGEQRALERRIMNRDNLTSAEKQHLIESTRTLSLGSQSGMSPHLLQSRKVAGAKFDSADGLDAYSRAINQHIARNAHSTELSQAMQRLDEHENANRGDADSTTRSIIANTMRDRVYDPNTGVNSKVSPLLHRLMTMSFINFLVRPSHIFLSQVHPYVYSVPMMAGRHGYWKALGAQKQAMKDLGGQFANLGRGAQRGADVFKSLREKDTDKAVALARGGDPIHDMIARLTDKSERDFLNNIYETQHLHSAYDSSMFAGSGVDRTNMMMQQFTNAMEANNRLSTALAAFRLEKEMHGDNAGAQAYAQRVIEETHGLYSPSNTAPIFKNPLLRATLQFHQQPMNLAFMLYRNAYKAFKGDTEARWTMAYQLGTAAMLGGMGGMPMDLPKLAGLATQPITGMAPSDWDDKMRREMADTLGPTVTNAIMEGLPGLMGPLGPSLGHRMGFDAGLINDEPKSGSGGDILSWVAKNVAGAPGGMLTDWLDGMAATEQGDYQKAAEKFLPGSLKDFAKAYREATTGTVKGGKTIREASFGDALLQMLGFSGVERERQMEGHYKLQEAIKAQDEAQKQTKGEQLKAKHAAKKTVLGVPVSKKHAALESEYGSAYQ